MDKQISKEKYYTSTSGLNIWEKRHEKYLHGPVSLYENYPEPYRVSDHRGVNPVEQIKLQKVQRTCGYRK